MGTVLNGKRNNHVDGVPWTGLTPQYPLPSSLKRAGLGWSEERIFNFSNYSFVVLRIFAFLIFF